MANTYCIFLFSVAMEITTSSEQPNSGDDVPFENTSDTEQSIPMETNEPDQINSEGSIYILMEK